MDNDKGQIELIRRAQLGDRDSMNRLTELVEPRLFVYLYRLTLNHDLAQDLLQDTLVKMIESLNELKHAERFWRWLFRTALGKVQHYYRDRKRKQTVQIDSLGIDRLSEHVFRGGDHEDGLSVVMRKELSETVCGAMMRLRVVHRNVLILRCFEQMSYVEIAETLDCKELGARVLFFRAKRSLRRQLSHKGFSKGLLLTALGLYGLITAPAKGTTAVGTATAGLLDVGAAAAFVATLGTKLGLATITVLTALSVGLTSDKFLPVLALISYGALCFLISLYLD